MMMVVAFLGLASTTAWAQETISVEVRMIAADDEADHLDNSLEDLRDRLARGFRDYSSFSEIDRQRQSIAFEESASFELPTGDTLILTNNGHEDNFVKLGLNLESRLSTTLRATPGSTFFQAGLRHEENLLILAITVGPKER